MGGHGRPPALAAGPALSPPRAGRRPGDPGRCPGTLPALGAGRPRARDGLGGGLGRGAHARCRASPERCQDPERQVARRVSAGELARVDLLLAQQEALAREVELQTARSDLDLATQRFALADRHAGDACPAGGSGRGEPGAPRRSPRACRRRGQSGPGACRARASGNRAPVQSDPQSRRQADPRQPRQRPNTAIRPQPILRPGQSGGTAPGRG